MERPYCETCKKLLFKVYRLRMVCPGCGRQPVNVAGYDRFGNRWIFDEEYSRLYFEGDKTPIKERGTFVGALHAAREMVANEEVSCRETT